jgi:DNA polymerase alpha subunit A
MHPIHVRFRYVLDQILSGEDTEVVVEKIHEYLSTIGENIRAGALGVDEFIVFKVCEIIASALSPKLTQKQRLGKNPEDYPDGKSQPHVQVALRLKTKGQSARAGDVVPYVFCLGEDGQPAKTAQADRARHPDELRKAGSVLKIGRVRFPYHYRA